MKNYIRYLLANCTTILKYIKYKEDFIFVDGFPHTINFGDALNTPLVEYLSGRSVLPSKNISRILFGVFKFQNFAVIGSILQWAKKDAEIWGAGFISDNSKIALPKKVYAVRGPKTREIYLKNKIDCPEIYGDPALLFPLIYNPAIQKKYSLGIIPHYVDRKNPWILKMQKREDVLVIDLLVGYDYKKVIDQILQCEKILSSSLHGIILSDAYRIPNRQINLSNKVTGANFKFIDYYQSVGRKVLPALSPEGTDLRDIEFNTEITIDIRELLNCCPFILPDIKQNMISKLEASAAISHVSN